VESATLRQDVFLEDTSPTAECPRHRLYYEMGGAFADFVIDPARWEITYTTNQPDAVPSLLEGMVLGTYARLTGQGAIHASVLVRDGRALAVSGVSGAGKSTFSWMLIQAGWRLLSDDQLYFTTDGERVLAHPGRFRLRLNVETADWLGLPEAERHPVYPVDGVNKIAVDLPGKLCTAATPLERLIILQPRRADLSSPAVDPLTGPQGLSALLEHLYGQVPPEGGMRRVELQRLMSLAAHVPVANVTLPDSLDSMEAHLDTLLEGFSL
jgi:hypothetical protein